MHFTLLLVSHGDIKRGYRAKFEHTQNDEVVTALLSFFPLLFTISRSQLNHCGYVHINLSRGGGALQLPSKILSCTVHV